MSMIQYLHDDGGRAAAGFKGSTGDCVCRAIAIAAEMPYQTVYDDLNRLGQTERVTSRKPGRSNARIGVYTPSTRRYLLSLGWTWVPTMTIGAGCTVHLRADELPMGRIIVKLSRHLAAVIDGVLHDNHDSSRGGTRCVYGYYTKGAANGERVELQ